MAGGEKDRRGPTSRWRPPAGWAALGLSPVGPASLVLGDIGGGLGAAWLQTGPTGPPHLGEPAVSREGGGAGAAALSRCRACRKDGLTLDAVCLLEANGTVCVWTPLTHCWHIFLVFFCFFFFFFCGRVTSSCVWS